MIILYTDFSQLGPYVGQLKSVISQYNPDSKIIDLIHDAPMFDVKHSAYFLNSLTPYFSDESVFCCVVDPGVGGTRNNIVVKADNKYYIGPDNGLFEYIIRSASKLEYYTISWEPEVLSTTFHGRDIYAPIAAQIDSGFFEEIEKIAPKDVTRFNWPNDLYEIIYIDSFGNLMTGIRATSIDIESILHIKGEKVYFSKTYTTMPDGQVCWYVNSNGLIEIALNKDNAGLKYDIKIGEAVGFLV